MGKATARTAKRKHPIALHWHRVHALSQSGRLWPPSFATTRSFCQAHADVVLPALAAFVEDATSPTLPTPLLPAASSSFTATTSSPSSLHHALLRALWAITPGATPSFDAVSSSLTAAADAAAASRNPTPKRGKRAPATPAVPPAAASLVPVTPTSRPAWVPLRSTTECFWAEATSALPTIVLGTEHAPLVPIAATASITTSHDAVLQAAPALGKATTPSGVEALARLDALLGLAAPTSPAATTSPQPANISLLECWQLVRSIGALFAAGSVTAGASVAISTASLQPTRAAALAAMWSLFEALASTLAAHRCSTISASSSSSASTPQAFAALMAETMRTCAVLLRAFWSAQHAAHRASHRGSTASARGTTSSNPNLPTAPTGCECSCPECGWACDVVACATCATESAAVCAAVAVDDAGTAAPARTEELVVRLLARGVGLVWEGCEGIPDMATLLCVPETLAILHGSVRPSLLALACPLAAQMG